MTVAAGERSLAGRLERLFEARGGEGGRILRARQRPCRYRSTHALDEVDLRFANGAHRLLMLKGYGAATRIGDTVRPSFVTDPYRELWAYETVLERLGMPTAKLYGTLDDHAAGDGRMVLERAPGVELYDVGELDAWLAAARWLGAFHVRGSALIPELLGTGHLLRQDASLHRQWLRRARRFAREKGRRSDLARLDELGEPYERAVRLLEREPRTLLHGEYYASNLIVQRRAGRWSACAIDWESLAVGPAALDLVALTSGDWDASARAGMMAAYAAARAATGVGAGVGADPSSTGDCGTDSGTDLTPDPGTDSPTDPGTDPATDRTTDPATDPGIDPGVIAPSASVVCAAELVTAIQWLGWSDRWAAPRQHAQDWLEVAVDAARRLGA